MGIFDDISSSVNRGFAGASRATSTLKLRNQIADINKQRTALAAQLGASLYHMTKDIPDFRAGREQLYDGIAQLDAERDACNAEIARIEAESQSASVSSRVYVCPSCGAKVADTDMFCSGCGISIDKIRAAYQQAAPEPQSTGAAFCPKCGTPITPGDTFCMSCGMKLDRAPIAPSAADAPAQDDTANEADRG